MLQLDLFSYIYLVKTLRQDFAHSLQHTTLIRRFCNILNIAPLQAYISMQAMRLSGPHILAKKGRAKLLRDASNPNIGLRIIVTQANMLDRLMDHITNHDKQLRIKLDTSNLELTKEAIDSGIEQLYPVLKHEPEILREQEIADKSYMPITSEVTECAFEVEPDTECDDDILSSSTSDESTDESSDEYKTFDVDRASVYTMEKHSPKIYTIVEEELCLDGPTRDEADIMVDNFMR